MVAANAAVTGKTVNVADTYADDGDFDFSGTRTFDEKTGYRSRSLLAVPMRNHDDEVIGVLQLLNAKDAPGGESRPFTAEEERLVTSLASQAAIAMTNRRLIEEQRELFMKKAQIWAATRDFLKRHGFLEVETPSFETYQTGCRHKIVSRKLF